jgi:hypothetical protein
MIVAPGVNPGLGELPGPRSPSLEREGERG